MKQQKKTQFLIIASIFLISILFLSIIRNNSLNVVDSRQHVDSVTMDEKKVKSNSFWSITSLHIDASGGNGNGTWAWAKAQGYCTGDGNWSNPYTIENFTANANGGEFGIKIENSKNVYFVIRNCSATNAGRFNQRDGGIELVNTCNGTIFNNTCSGNLRHGLVLDTDCKNNTIIDNLLINNQWQGLHLYNSNNNTIIFNDISNNDGPSGTGIGMYSSNYNNISKNTIDNNNFGIYILSSNDNVFQDNNFTNNGAMSIFLVNAQYRNKIIGNLMYQSGIEIWGAEKSALVSLTLTKTNLLNDKPIYYYVNETYLQPINFSNAGQIFLVNCNHSKITGIDISNSINGLTLFHSVNNTISQNSFNWNDNDGIYLYYSNNNTIYDNEVNSNGAGYGYGINIESSDFNNISENTCYNNYYGIDIWLKSDSNYVYNNTVRSSISFGILLQELDPDYISKNKIIGNTIYDNNDAGLGLIRCSSANISGNTLFNNDEHGIRIVDSFNINVLGNNASLNEKNGIYLRNCDNIYIYNNSATFNDYNGIYMENSNNSEIVKNNVSKNTLDGINFYNSHHNVITNSTINSNGVSGITLIDSNYNKIENNSETINHNGNYGVFLANSHYNNITWNSISYQPIGIYITNSYNNIISPNTFFGNGIDIFSGAIIIDNGSSGGGGGGDGSAKDEFPIIIIIIIIIGGVVSVSSLAVRSSVKKGKVSYAGKNGYSKEQNVKAKKAGLLKYENDTNELATTKSGKEIQKKAKSIIDEYQKKGERLEPVSKSQELTEAEKAELAKTEAEMEVDKQKFICVVHRGPIYGIGIYLCRHCETFYCERCAKVLKINGEKCWNCENEIEIEISDKDRIRLLNKKTIDLIDEIINENPFLQNFIKTNQNLESISPIKDYLFSLITLEELDKIDSIELSPEEKKRFIKELLPLDPDERAEYLEKMLNS